MKISDKEIQRVCSPVICKRGTEFYQDGRVHIKSREENSISAVVDDDEIYNIKIDFDGDKITNCFCTCPYYRTMGANCKHIAAVLKKRQSELSEGENYKDENDRIAKLLCGEFAGNCFEKKRLGLKYIFTIITAADRSCRYSIELMCGFDEMRTISGVDRFLDCYINGTDFKISKHTAINASNYSLSDNDREIIGILCEAYQNKLSDGGYVNRVSKTYIASITAKRIFPMLLEADCEIYFNTMQLSNFTVREENPDIVIDINATDSEISLNVFESGTALFDDGSWFLFENDFYRTDSEWRSWFMPIYRALVTESRTQIDFKDNARVDFATYVYPKLRNRRGVVTAGLDSLVINEKPKFSVYLDAQKGKIIASVVVGYGSIRLLLPAEMPSSEKIVIRDMAAESDILKNFSTFSFDGNGFVTDNSDVIFDFITNGIKTLYEKAEIYTSDSFNNLKSNKSPRVKTDVRYKKDIDLLEISFETELSNEEIAGILDAVRTKKAYYKLKNGSFLPLNEETERDFLLLDNLNFSDRDIAAGHKNVTKYHILYIDALEKEGRLTSDKAFKDLIKQIKSIKADIPKSLKAVLRKYQIDGVNWLKQLSELGYGGILADDMGLGKTLEVIAFVMSEKRNCPVLVTAPSALTYNWIHEIEKFAPEASACIIDGSREERGKMLSEIGGYDFVITSYPLLRRDVELYSKNEFSYMFIDESQQIKNPDTMIAKAVKRIRASKKFALSGTPIENNLIELWSVFDYAMKGYLGTRKDFAKRYTGLESEANTKILSELRKKIRPFVMRRMKTDVLSELPEKIEHTIYSDFVPEQKKLYEAFLMAAKKEVRELADNGGSSIKILTLLLRLRQICCHPALFDEAYKKDSGKLILLEELLNSATSQGHRVLVFSQFTSMLTIIRKRLAENNTDCFYIDGKTPSDMRTALAEKFNAGEKNIFLVSLKAGGTGLNLTGADMVIHYDPWWNPAVMDQASDRAYRIGQTKAVQVIKLAAKGTIEEQILKLQEKKRRLADSVIKKNTKTIAGLSREEILGLFE